MPVLPDPAFEIHYYKSLKSVAELVPQLHIRSFLYICSLKLLYCRSILPKVGGISSEPSSSEQPSSEVTMKAETTTKDFILVNEEMLHSDHKNQEDNTIACITEEWEQLVVNEDSRMYSPSCLPRVKLDQSSGLPRDSNRQLDRETSRILERLEVPRLLKTKVVSPVSNVNLPTKKPLVPFQPIQATEPVSISSQLIKPNFQRLKRKHK